MRSYRQLTQEERYRITAHRMSGDSHAEIARLLDRHPSTIGRELRRNATAHGGDYRAEKAHSYATAGDDEAEEVRVQARHGRVAPGSDAAGELTDLRLEERATHIT